MTEDVAPGSSATHARAGRVAPPPVGRWWVRLALHRPELRAWAMYDWANSAVWTTVVAAVFPVYFSRVAGAGLGEGAATTRFALATTLGLVLTAVLAPLLGAVADASAVRKKMLGGFLAAGVLATGWRPWPSSSSSKSA